MKKDRTQELETGSIKSLLWTYALPAVITQIIASIYNIADRIFIGQGVGPLAISGLVITLPVINAIHALGSLVGVGSAARMSIVLGRKDINWAENILGNSLLLTFFFGMVFLSGGYAFMDKVLILFGATDQTISYAREYMLIVLPGMFFTTLTFNLTGLIRATGYPMRSMYIMVSGALLNMILDPIFIYVFDAGIAGAAWATTISMATTSVLAVAHFISPSSFIRFRSHAWKPRFYIFKNILLIGMSPFLMNLAASAVVALLNTQVIRYAGDLGVGALGIVNTFTSLLCMVMIGICQGMQPIAGYNYGAGRPGRLKEVFMLTMKVNVLLGLAGSVLCLAFPRLLVRAFTADAELLEVSAFALPFLLVMAPLIGFTITNSNFFQSIDKPWIAIVTSLSRQVLFLAPLCILIPKLFISMGWGDGMAGVCASATISDALGAVLAGILLLTQLKVFKEKGRE
ncbi:MAG: MATE family efflux transporter [Bacteroidales bacterium]|nr:MATE family efflux transporter [Bacteroidales bacterium]